MDVRSLYKAKVKYLSQFGLVILLAATLIPAVATPAAAQEPSGSAQTQPSLSRNPIFTHISIEQGLSDLRVTAIVQDPAGFMWFGTTNGLNRYDGYDVVAYRNDPANPDSLSSNFIDSMYQDRSGTIWAGTRSGLNAFDQRTERFTRYLHDPADSHSLSNNVVLAIYEDRSGTIWAGTRGGLNAFDRRTEQFTRYQNDPADPGSLSNNVVLAIYEDRAGVLWVGTNGGLNRFDRTSGSFTVYRHDPDNPQSLSHDSVWDIYEDRTGTFWLATDGGGLNRFDRETETFTSYRNDPQDPHSLGADRLDSLFEDASGALWISTFGGGLSVLDPARGTFKTYRRDLRAPTSLSEDYVTDIVADRSGLIWLGTLGGGVNLYNPQSQGFIIYGHDPNAAHSLASDRVDAVYEDQDGVLWVGTQDRGLDRFDRRRGQVAHYPPDPENPQGLGHPFVRALEQDQAGALWVGTYGGGLYRLDPASGRFTPYRHDPTNPNSLSDETISDLHLDRSGALWIATLFGGLNRLDPKTGAFTAFRSDPANPQGLSSDWITNIEEDQIGNIWVGTMAGGGLNRLDPATGQVTRYQNDPENPASLADNNIFALEFDRDGVLWVGLAGSGVDRFDPAAGTFSHYRERDGLASDRIVFILEDGEGGDEAAGNLWVATGRGLSKLDRDRKTFHNYGPSDGLPLAEYYRAHYKTRSGELLFGNAQGLIAFDPAAVQGDTYVPPVVFTDFLLANKPVAIDQNSPLQQAINQTDTIELTYADRVISFEFAALSYRLPQQNRYRYKLEGFDPEWIEVDAKRRLATYTNLDPGRYVFRVTGSNNAGVWNETGRAITLIVTPPWWATWWFPGLALVLVSGAVATGYVWRVNNLKAQQRRLEALVAERTRELAAKNEALEVTKNQAEAANQAKSIFLTRMNHELRTPLTTILGYTQLMQHDPLTAATQHTNLSAIDRSGEHLLALIDDVLDMSRIEAGKTTLKLESFDLLNLLTHLEGMFRLRAVEQGLQFNLELAPNLPRYIEADEHKLQQVLLNLLSNAFKFTEQGSVTVRVTGGQQSAQPPLGTVDGRQGEEETRSRLPSPVYRLHFEVADTGPGLSAEEMAGLFEPFVQGQAGLKAQRGTGLGLAISRQFVQLMGGELRVASEGVPGHGSTFSFDLPLVPLAAGPAEAAMPGRRVTGLAPGQPATRLLVAEDNPDNRRWLVQLLAGAGFEVREAEDGQQAVQSWTEWQPQLILMDIGMPVMDGYEAIRHIKAEPGGLETAIIAITGSAFMEEREDFLAIGCADFLRKPFREQALFELLAQHLAVAYVYQEEPGVEPARPAAPAAGALAAIAPVWLERLEQAVARSDVEEIEQAIAAIRVADPALAEMLADLAGDFKYRHILALIQAAKNSQNRS